MAALKIKGKPGKSSTGKRKFKVNKNWVMLVVAIVIGGFGIHAANAFIKTRLDSYKLEQNSNKEKTIELVVPSQDLVKGTRLSADLLQTRDVPISFAHTGAVSPEKYTIALNQKLTHDLAAGRPLLWAHLESGEIKTFAASLPEGMRALSFSVDIINSISGFLEPQDRIDLFLTYKKNKQKITRPVIQNLLVLATDNKTRTQLLYNEQGGGGRVPASTLTVQVTPNDAKKIILAQEAGKITAVLRHPEDEKQISKNGMRISQLFIDGKHKNKKRKRTGIEFIIGGVK